MLYIRHVHMVKIYTGGVVDVITLLLCTMHRNNGHNMYVISGDIFCNNELDQNSFSFIHMYNASLLKTYLI